MGRTTSFDHGFEQTAPPAARRAASVRYVRDVWDLLVSASLAGFTRGEAAACAVHVPAPDPVVPVLDPGHIVAVV